MENGELRIEPLNPLKGTFCAGDYHQVSVFARSGARKQSSESTWGARSA